MTPKYKRGFDKRTSDRLAKLAGRVLSNDGECSPADARRLAACVLAQVAPADRKAKRRRR